ncbi:MAG: DUF3810 domain-containing protein [Candidatus Eremiobacteraeota bacterium]|nr:DUF3810 domain-containing protein [Candidatus Eremiobacteraeota bacterium]
MPALELACIVAGIGCAVYHPTTQWVETRFSNGYFPGWERAWAAIGSAFPFALGDAFALLATALVLWRLSVALRRRSLRALIDVAAVAGVLAVWFYAGWGWGYNRAPIETRVKYDSAKVDAAAIGRLQARAVAQVNRLAPLAHSQSKTQTSGLQLAVAWQPVVQRLGDSWQPAVDPAKPTFFGPFMAASGTSGFVDPFTLETQLAPDLLWFEIPFSQAHEWSHVAGFNREDEANYIAILTCLRDQDVVAQYSGWLEMLLYLPSKHYRPSDFAYQVRQDFAALRERNAKHINVGLSRFSWHLYNAYLKSNHVAKGIQNYNEVTRLLVGIPLDRNTLPQVR